MKKLWLAILLAAAMPLGAQKRDKDRLSIPTSVVNFMVIKDYNGKPVRNASVVLHEVSGDGKQDRGGYELKTDPDGKASYEGVPYGKLRVQVLARGYQTFGEDYTVGQPTMEITVKMKRPEGQYSIYEDHPEEKKDKSQ